MGLFGGKNVDSSRRDEERERAPDIAERLNISIEEAEDILRQDKTGDKKSRFSLFG